MTETIIEDGHDVFISSISHHFLGSPKEHQAATKSILINLRCSSLSDYCWYKDVFLTNVLKREDRLQGFWEERFRDGLLQLFGQRILAKLR